MNARLTLALILIALPLLPTASAADAGESACSSYRWQHVSLQSNVIAQGEHTVRGDKPGCGIGRSPTQIFQWTAESNAPVVLAPSVTPTITWVATGFSGCTVGTISFSSWSTSAGSGSSADALITMTSTECHGFILYRYKLIVSSVTVYDYPVKLPINTRVEQPNYYFNCAATGVSENAFVPGSTACATPTTNEVLSGSITATLTGTVTLAGGITISGTLDQLMRLCAASPLASPCTTPIVLNCSTAALATDPKACTENSTTGNTNVTNVVTLPQPLRVQAVCTSSALTADPAACGTPTLTNSQNLMLSGFIIGLLYFLAIMCSRFKEPAVNFFGAGLAAIAGFRAFDAAGSWLGGAMVIVATFTLCAWCLISGGIRILNGQPIFERVTRGKRDITEI